MCSMAGCSGSTVNNAECKNQRDIIALRVLALRPRQALCGLFYGEPFSTTDRGSELHAEKFPEVLRMFKKPQPISPLALEYIRSRR
jgi:hypothetical protein